MKLVFSLFGVSVKSKHSLNIIKHIIDNPGSKTTLKVSFMSAVGPGVFIKVSSVTGMSVLAVDVKVLKYVIKTEGERLVGTLSVFALRLPIEVRVSVPELIILASSCLI